MNAKTFSIKLLIASLLGLGYLSGGLSARAEVTDFNSKNTVNSPLETISNHRQLQIACTCPNNDHPHPHSHPLSDFGQALLETAILATQQVDDPYQKTTLLKKIGRRYIQADQPALAADALAQALDAAEAMEHVYAQGHERVAIATLYGQNLDNAQRMDSIIQQTIETINPDEDNLADRDSLLAIITDNYAEAGRYERAREFFDEISDAHTQTETLYSLFYILEGLKENSEDNDSLESNSSDAVARLQQFFPEVETIVDSSVSANPRSIEFQAQDDPLMSFVLGLYNNPLQGSDSLQQDIENFITSKVALIEALPEPVMQAYGYAYLGLHLIGSPVPTQALPFLELAREQAQNIENLPPADTQERTLYSFPINYLLGMGFIQLGEVEKGLDLIRSIENTPERRYDKIQASLYIAESARQPEFRQLIEENISVSELIAEAEQIIESVPEEEGRADYLVEIANAYASVSDTDNARRIAQKLAANLTDEPSPIDDYAKYQLIELFSQIGDWAQAVDLAHTVEGKTPLIELSARLIGEQQEDLAWEALEAIPSLNEQARALVAMARQYEMQMRPETSWNTAVRALTLAESENLFRDADYSRLSREQIAELQRVERQNIISSVLSLYTTESSRTTAVREIEQLVERIVDDGLRAYAVLNFLPIQEALASIGDFSSLRGNDHALLHLARTTASSNSYEQSLTAIELMESPLAQATALIDLANRDSLDRPDVRVGDRAAILERIQQRYRVAQP